MRFKQILTCLFFGYLVLLLNLGQSLHRVHCLGLHSNDGVQSAACHSCCCREHFHLPIETANQPFSVNSDHDCAFCKFFDQCHVTIDVTNYEDSELADQLRQPRKPLFVFVPLLTPCARGPPAAA